MVVCGRIPHLFSLRHYLGKYKYALQLLYGAAPFENRVGLCSSRTNQSAFWNLASPCLTIRTRGLNTDPFEISLMSLTTWATPSVGRFSLQPFLHLFPRGRFPGRPPDTPSSEVLNDDGLWTEGRKSGRSFRGHLEKRPSSGVF